LFCARKSRDLEVRLERDRRRQRLLLKRLRLPKPDEP
jgi:hypothetical protein